MADWSIDPGFNDEPAEVPSGAECNAVENCGKTDCDRCGRDALFTLTKQAVSGASGLVAFAREVIRTEGSHGRYTPTLGMLARLRDIERPAESPAAQFYRRYASRRAFAWADGVVDAVSRNPWMVSSDFDDQLDEQAAYMIGRLVVELWLVNEHLKRLEAQHTAEVALINEIVSELIAEERAEAQLVHPNLVSDQHVNTAQAERDRRWFTRFNRAQAATRAEIAIQAEPWETP